MKFLIRLVVLEARHFGQNLMTPVVLVALAGAGCAKSGGGFDFLKDTNSVLTECLVTTVTPANDDTLKLSGLPGATTEFTVGLSAAACKVKFTLNGTDLSTTGAALSLPSDSLLATTNTLVATSGLSTKTWTIVKNHPAVCGVQTPTPGGISLGAGGSLTLLGSATDADNDTLAITWKLNTASVANALLAPTTSGNSSQAIFTPLTSNLGNNTVSMEVSDGTDTVKCSWPVEVTGACAVTSTTPLSSSPVRVAQNANSASIFQATATAGCAYSWKLNGTTIAAQTASSLTLDSTTLNAGNNTLQVVVGNGSSSDSKTWNVVRNIPPTCASQAPASAGNSVGLGGNIALDAVASDLNNDALTFNWTVNGANVGSTFAITSAATTSHAVFTPTSSSSTSNTIKAVISDGLDSASCAWDVQTVPVCSFLSSSPTTSSFRVSANGSSSTTFVATPNDSSCTLTWKLNGNVISGETSQILKMLSSQLSAGPATNTLVATAANSYTNATRTWTITKNQAPSCANQTPPLSGNNVGVGGSISFIGTAGNPDADALTYTWTYNGLPASSSYFAISSSGQTAQAVFTPVTAQIGNSQTVSVGIDDGYDSTSCNWTVNVVNACVVSSTTPSAPGPVKVPALSTANTPFQASANSGCNYSWSLNGSAISGATANGYILNSGALTSGNNVLQVSVTNGISTDTKSWTVVKNTPTSCGTQNPAVTGNSVGAGGNIVFQLNAGNTDNDNLTYNWKYNGSAINTTYFTPTAFGNSAQVSFSPNSSFVGNNQTVTVGINDGYDDSSCSWNVNVLNSCTISSTAPSNASAVRVASVSSSGTTFQAPANAGCTYTWTLNGSAISGATSGSQTVLPSDLTPGNNSLVVSVTNGSSTDSKTWNVVKNTPPVCSSQTPGASGNNIAVGGAITLNANATDANSDTLTFAWKDNGVAAGSQFAITNSTGASQGIFTPDSTNVGTNSVQAVISDGYDTSTCSWAVQVAPSCAISSSNPTTTSVKVASLGSTSSSFVATPSDASCNVSWSLNGTTISGATNPVVSVLSSALSAAPATNTLTATATNGYSTATRSWALSKNQPPICSSQTPSTTGNSLAAGGTMNFQAVAGNPDSDALNYAWTYNGAAVGSQFAVTSSGNNSQAIFSPTNAAIGNNQTVAVSINDSYDTAICSWNVDVLNACSLSSISPAATALKVANLGSTSTAFSANATSGCAFTWKLNGTTISGATAGAYSVLSSALNAGSNTLQVSVSNGASSDTRSWTVTKNIPPSCGSQTPIATGNNVGVGGSIVLQGNASNVDNDTLTYAWSYNGAAASATYFSTSYFGNAAQATFTPDSSFIGTNQTVAVQINDGYDVGSCSWNVNVQNSCTISTQTPSAASSVRVPYATSASTTFQGLANPGCTYTWKLNGSSISGATSNGYGLSSGDLSPGNNTLQVSVTNGTSTDSKTWTVVRNTPPVCSSQTPSATGNTTAVGVASSFTANATDANSDTLTFAWKLNGLSSASQLAVTNGTGTSGAVFTPDATSVGTNSLVAAISDGYDTVNCSWTTQVLPACQISTSTPAATNPKVPFAASTTDSFYATPNDSSCSISWALNGTSLGISSPVANLTSSQFSNSPTTNTLTATVTNSYTTATRTWTVAKNQVPTCSSQTPAATGGTVGVGGSLTFSSVAGNPDSDTLSYAWTYNGSAVNPTYFAVTSSGNNSQAVFSPNSSYVGSSQSVGLTISDGYDSAVCSWNVSVANACIISTVSPAIATTVKMANASSGTAAFNATANPGCNYAWSLNGTTISGQTASNLQLSSSQLSGGNNTLQVTASNGTSTDSKTWNVLKNSPPICSSQTPSSTGSVVAVGASLNLVANGIDANSDALTYTWYNNGSAVGGQFAISNASGSSTAAMTANSALVGTNAIRADISDGLDTTSCSWSVQVKPPCLFSSASPVTATYKMPFSSSATQSFIASANDSSCAISWKLNGSTISGQTSALYSLPSSSLTAGPTTNSLVATATDGYTTATQTWTVTKNQLSTCSAQTPSTTSSSVGVGGNATYNLTAGNPDTDTLTYSWIYNGAPVNTSFFTTSSSGNTAQAVFTPNSSYAGTGQTVGVNIADGYDTVNCAWSVNVVNTCSISSASPTSTSYRVPFLASTQTTFIGVPSDSSCSPSWTLNGTSVSTSSVVTLNSSSFTNGPTANTLTLTLNNGVSTPTTRTWTVTKNRVPTCASQTPVASPGSMVYTNTRNFTAAASDADGDALNSFSWLYNGAVNNSLFSAISTNAGGSSSTFTPTLSQVGTGQSVGLQFTDGYDIAQCSWNFDITNPNVVAVTSCTPSTNPVVVYSTGLNSTQTLQVVAANATSNGYKWLQGGTQINGVTASSYAVSAASYSPGTYSFRGIASDAQGNTDFCDFPVKVNAPPVINSFSPVAVQTYKVNYGSTMTFSVSATDANSSDTLVYNWTLDGSANSALGTGSASSVLNPNYAASLIGTHTVMVTVTDGYETATKSWTVEINLFSAACNTLYNSTTSGGQICTLVGVPGMGSGNVPSADQTQIRVQPAMVIDDGAGNWIFSDQLNHTVNFYNRSASSITRWGLTMGAGTLTAVIGNGASGITIDNVSNRQFKLDSPVGIAYDTSTKYLYIADRNNHRVAQMDNTGLVTTVIGTTTAAALANNATNNADGVAGTATACNAPSDVRVVNYGGARWLYVTCSGQNSIRRMDILPNSSTFGKTYMVVGRLSTSGATYSGTADGTLGTTGTATAYEPWALSDDGNGNIYWSESTGVRVRMAATGGSQVSFFSGASQATSYSMTVNGLDLTQTLTTGTTALQPVATSGSVTKLVMYGPASVATGVCTLMRVQAQNASSVATALAGPTAVTLGGNGVGTFYSDAGCSSTATTATILNNDATALFYFKSASAASFTFTGAAGALTSASLAVTTAAASTATKIALYAPPTILYTTCVPVTVQMQNASSVVSTYGSARTIQLQTNGIGTFYSNSTCSTVSPTVTIASGASEGTIYYASNIIAPANQSVSLFGTTPINGVNPTTTASVGIGAITLRYPRGLAVATSGGNVSGFFVTSWDNHRIIYVNNTASTTTIGGTAVAAASSAVVIGTGTAGFNTDGLANVTRTNNTYGVAMSYDQTKVLFADLNNFRVRYTDLSTANGQVVTEIGAGRQRAGNLGDSPIAAPQMYLNAPTGMVVDNTNRKLYVADSSNSRIRRVDMLTGYVDTMIGKGAGAASVEGEDPTNAYMGNPRGLALMTANSTNFLVYSDQYTAGANSDCQIRALNLTPNISSPPPATLFGVSIPAFKVSTLIGDYGTGCVTQGAVSAPNVIGTGTSVKPFNTEGITSDGTNMYFANYGDHCIMKTTPTGSTSVVVGTCGTAGLVDGNQAAAQIRYPTAIVVDPSYASDGNFFFADAPDQNPTRIRYVNFRTSSVTIGNFTVPAAAAGNAQITTLWTIAVSNGGRVYGLAAFGTQLCIAGGYPTSGSIGTHNVTCYDRSTSLAPVTLRVGPNEASSPPFRAGAPMSNTEQEGIAATSAFMSAPYGLAFDTAGNLYISERNNHIIRMVRRWF